MGGKLLETESERLIHIGEEKGIRSLVETCQEVGLSVSDAVEKLISKFGLTETASLAKVNKYWK